MMNKEKKKNYISEMTASFENSEAVLVTHYQGLTVKQLDDLRKQMYSLYGELGIPENLAEKYWLKPANLAVVFSVDKVFVQTPGPDAGKQI